VRLVPHSALIMAGSNPLQNSLKRAIHIGESPSIGAAFATAMRPCQKLLPFHAHGNDMAR
jgi:hypothetical protein